MDFFKYRKSICSINEVYSNYNKCDFKTQKDKCDFGQSLIKCYNKIEKDLDEKKYIGFLKYQYNRLKNEYENSLSLVLLWISTFIPTIFLTDELLSANLNIIVKLLVMLGIEIVAFLVVSFPLCSVIRRFHPERTFEKVNFEIEYIKDKLKKDQLAPKNIKLDIDKKLFVECFIAIFFSTIITLLINHLP